MCGRPSASGTLILFIIRATPLPENWNWGIAPVREFIHIPKAEAFRTSGGKPQGVVTIINPFGAAGPP
jgi:hypothetical protein